MSDDTKKKQIPLAAEHLQLGAHMESLAEDGPAVPTSYGDVVGEAEALMSGCGLVDLSGALSLAITGKAAGSFVSAAFGGRRLDVAECSFEAVLTGDGHVASIPLLGRTGDEEYVLWDASEGSDLLDAWLGFLQGIEQDGFRPYAEVSVEDASESLVPLLLWGEPATAILEDYLREEAVPPSRGQIVDVLLDGRIQALVVGAPLDHRPAYLLLVPPRYAVVMWRSLLSFRSVTPVGRSAFDAVARQHLPWLDRLRGSGPYAFGRSELLGRNLIRQDSTYVGARALSGQEGND